jgi:hypothetical protein
MPWVGFEDPSVRASEYCSCLRPRVHRDRLSDENALRIFERKIVRKIYGPVCEGGVWRVRSISESNCLLQREDIVRHAKYFRLSWLVMWSVWRVRGTPKCLLNCELFGVRRRRRPRKRWFHDVHDDLRRIRIGKSKEKAQELIAKEAKTHQGL